MKGRQWTARKLDFLDTNELERTLTQSVLQLNSTFPVKVLVLYNSFCSKLVVSLTLMMPLTLKSESQFTVTFSTEKGRPIFIIFRKSQKKICRHWQNVFPVST